MKREPDIFALPVHPAADVFPMLPEDELEELAESIKIQGLLNSIVVQSIDGKLVLVDGRNRREACRRVGVEPTYTLLDGQDVAAYVLSTNINRRHMTKGQRAMATAIIKPEAKMGRGSTAEKVARNLGVSGELVRQARVVLKHTPDHAKLVLSGAMSLDAAYEEARNHKATTEGAEGAMQSLRAEAPDLADQVVEGTLSLGEARAALMARKQKEITDRYCDWSALNHASSLVRYSENPEAFGRLSGHWHEFQAQTQHTRADLIGHLKTLQGRLPQIIRQIQKSED